MELEKITPDNIKSFVAQLYKGSEYSVTTINHFLKTLKIFFNYCVLEEKLAVNQCLRVEALKEKSKEMKIYNTSQIITIIEYSRNSFPHMVLPIMLGAFEGLRRGEICGLRTKNFNPDTKSLQILNNAVQINGKVINTTPKSSLSVRSILLSDKTYTELLNTSFGTDFLLEMDGRQINPEYITHTWRKILMKMEFEPIRFHDLRHSHATILLEAGIHPKVVSERLGHTVDMALNTYSHVTPNIQREAVNILNKAINKKN